MTSNWALPTTIEQYSEEGAESVHVPWNSDENFNNIKTKNGKSLKTIRDLVHIARDPKIDITEKTYFLRCTGFTFVNLPNTVSGVELKITSNRFGRITDDVIQLTLNGNLIGENYASLSLEPIKIYGNEDDKWNTDLTSQNILSNSFGVVIRFKSHPSWPHKSNIFLDCIELRIH